MATLDQLYTRLILDLNRDDMGSGGELEQAKIDAVADAITKYANELFWFNRASGTVATVASTTMVALPSGMRIAQSVNYLGADLLKVDLATIESCYNATTVVTGLPTWWAEDGGNIHFYLTPNAVYTMSVYGIAELGVPGSTNAWTTEAYDLILSQAKVFLCRGPLRDADGLAFAKDGVEEALAYLRKETRRRGAVDARTDIHVGQRYNINAG